MHAFANVFITMASSERHVAWNHRSFHRLFNSLCSITSKKHQSPFYWPFMRGIHKGPVRREKLPFDDVIKNYIEPTFITPIECHDQKHTTTPLTSNVHLHLWIINCVTNVTPNIFCNMTSMCIFHWTNREEPYGIKPKLERMLTYHLRPTLQKVLKISFGETSSNKK